MNYSFSINWVEDSNNIIKCLLLFFPSLDSDLPGPASFSLLLFIWRIWQMVALGLSHSYISHKKDRFPFQWFQKSYGSLH